MAKKCEYFLRYCDATVGDYDDVMHTCPCIACQGLCECAYGGILPCKPMFFDELVRNRCRECIVNKRNQKER